VDDGVNGLAEAADRRAGGRGAGVDDGVGGRAEAAGRGAVDGGTGVSNSRPKLVGERTYTRRYTGSP
jgi:hypothetical protein